MYEGGHRVPAIAWWPGRIQSGAVCDQTIITFDLFPTLLNLAGLGEGVVKPPLDGTNIASVLFDDADLPKRTLFWRMGDGKAVRQGPWKLVVRGGTAELYNLRDDVGEAADLAAERKDLVDALQSELAAWEKDVDSDNTQRTATSADPVCGPLRASGWAGGEEELYDHRTDPHEWHNLAGAREHAKVKQELRDELRNLTGR